ncbi:hypothetical protein [Nocardioides sp. B-3]|uniref:hypothetical protein n=1 Tax=Nocardioides sp. B-3 TaxID=2895565 RepID=UPI00215268ED|nr:hypothetical protein [Nocardioides sp. B-3]UUZ59722.1 hypothetical protein LP418_00910 [Nocardioides sp. B-3]
MSGFNSLRDNMFDAYSTELEALDLRSEATADRAAEIADTTDELAAEKKTIDEKLADAEDLPGRPGGRGARAPADLALRLDPDARFASRLRPGRRRDLLRNGAGR